MQKIFLTQPTQDRFFNFPAYHCVVRSLLIRTLIPAAKLWFGCPCCLYFQFTEFESKGRYWGPRAGSPSERLLSALLPAVPHTPTCFLSLRHLPLESVFPGQEQGQRHAFYLCFLLENVKKNHGSQWGNVNVQIHPSQMGSHQEERVWECRADCVGQVALRWEKPPKHLGGWEPGSSWEDAVGLLGGWAQLWLTRRWEMRRWISSVVQGVSSRLMAEGKVVELSWSKVFPFPVPLCENSSVKWE